MIPQNNGEAVFYMVFYKLKKYCEESIFKIERATDDKNIELINVLNENSFNITPEIKQKVQEALVIKRKIEIYQTIFQQIKYLANNYPRFNVLPKEAPQVFETILWLLGKFRTQAFLLEVKQAITAAYGSKTLTYLEQFSHLNLKSFEQRFEIEISLNEINKYISEVQSLYRPQLFRRADSVGSEGFANKPNSHLNNNHTGPRLPSNTNTPIVNSPSFPSISSMTDYEDETPKRADKGPKNPIFLNVGNARPEDLRQDMAFLNQSNLFDFNRPKNNLQISLVKGLKKDNIEFYDQVEPALRANGDSFTDDSFPPEMSSLTSKVSDFSIAEKVVWKRISEVYKKKNINLCSDQVGPNDIQQGHLGDCYFLSALSVLAEKKNFITRLFHSKEISSTGCYSVWLCDSGEWKNIIIDDYVPCVKFGSDYKPAFSNSKSGDIWVLLLEKAFAKLYGNYYTIDGGYQSEALYGLTGAPTKYFKEKKNGIDPLEQIWLFVTGSLQNSFIVTAASKGTSQILNNKSIGIVTNHAYALLDAKEVSLSNGKKVKLIKMRNPWGDYEWKGDWGDHSPLWTPEIKKFLKYESVDGDGIFWISLADFENLFDSICSCQIHDDYYFSFIRLGENRKQNHFISKMTVGSDGFVYLTLQQKMSKHFKKSVNYEYSFARIILAKLGQNGQITSIVHGKYKISQSVVIRKSLQRGEYLVFIEVDWNQKFYNEVNLTAYSRVKVDMQEESLSNYDIPTLYLNFLKAYIRTAGDNQMKAHQYDLDENKLQIHKYKLEKFGLLVLYFTNYEKDITLNVRFTVKKMVNMELVMPKVSNNIIFVTVPGGQERMIIFKAKVTDTEDHSYAYEYSEISKFSQNLTKEQLKQLCLQKGKKIQSLKNGLIEAFSYKYLGGFADYYINKGTKGVLQEEMVFEATNILVNGEETKRIEFFVAPGQDYLVDMKIKDIFEASKCSRQTKSLVVG